MAFVKATRKQRKLRMALMGPSGSGKTFTALSIAKHLGEPIGVIDTERSSADLYAGQITEFFTSNLDSYEPKNYVKAMKEAAEAGFQVLVIDSLSHAWVGKGGILDQSNARGNKFDAWRHLTPQHNEMIDAMLAYPGHVIVTMRTKTDYLVEKDEKTGKQAVKKVGLAPVQKEGMEYEMDIVGTLDIDNTLTIDKTRCSALTGSVIRRPGEDLAKTILNWLTSGEAESPVVKPTAPATTAATEAFLEKIKACGTRDDITALNDSIKAAKEELGASYATVVNAMKARWAELGKAA